MKIFNWVHRKLHQNVDYRVFSHKKGELGQNEKKTETVTCETETDALLDHATFGDVPEGWKDGLLSIGTLGFDPLKPFNQLNDHSVQEEEEEEEEGKLNPSVVKAFKREFEKVFGSSSNTGSSAGEPNPSTASDDAPLIRYLELPQLKNDSEKDKKKKKKRGQRTTLADLILAESDVSKKSDSGDVHPDGVKKRASRTKHGLSFAKKFLLCKGENSRPTTKLHRLITRVLKRKIHPELEGKVHGMDGAINASKIEVGNKALGEDVTYNWREGDAAHDESLSLLQGFLDT